MTGMLTGITLIIMLYALKIYPFGDKAYLWADADQLFWYRELLWKSPWKKWYFLFLGQCVRWKCIGGISLLFLQPLQRNLYPFSWPHDICRTFCCLYQNHRKCSGILLLSVKHLWWKKYPNKSCLIYLLRFYEIYGLLWMEYFLGWTAWSCFPSCMWAFGKSSKTRIYFCMFFHWQLLSFLIFILALCCA